MSAQPSDTIMKELFELIEGWRPSETEWSAVQGLIERIMLESFSSGSASNSKFTKGIIDNLAASLKQLAAIVETHAKVVYASTDLERMLAKNALRLANKPSEL